MVCGAHFMEMFISNLDAFLEMILCELSNMFSNTAVLRNIIIFEYIDGCVA